MRSRFAPSTVFAISIAVMPLRAIAQTESPNDDLTPPTPPRGPVTAGATDPPERESRTRVTAIGYVEAYYAYNANRPSNGITNFRGFDNRHHTFSLANAALGANFESGPASGRLILQAGSTPSTYYASEPVVAGSRGANASSSELWKYLQEAFVSYKAPVGSGLLIQLGLFGSPIGIEVIPVKDNWNWSRSNLFFALPFYHTGLRATYELSDELAATLSLFNGWNSVVDNNEAKSVEFHVTYQRAERLLVQALYFGGIERARTAPEGDPWRHHVDLFGRFDGTQWLSFAAQADYGWESTRFGIADWAAGAIYARAEPIPRVYVAVRGDRFHENLAHSASGASSPLFWGGVHWVSSATLTLDARPHDQMSVRLEYRHDVASGQLYFRGDVQGDGSGSNPYLANAKTQDTVLLGATGWF